jgi:hypothetical protein
MFTIDQVYQTQISSLIESQFPEAIRDIMGPVFVEFVRLYFVWMETEGQVLYHSRRLMSYKDIDTTTDQFLVYFKEKYLKNIQLETNSNVKLLIKNSLDIYRSRGTPRAIDLLFRLVFGVGADVYYPGSDVFRLSDGQWVLPTYLEISLSNDSDKFVGKEITGVNSNARAFVEKLIRRKTQSQFNDIIYISSVIGTFQTGEKINAVVSPFSVDDCPTVVGSLTTLDVTDGGHNFSIGDVVTISSQHGQGGVGRVSATTQQTGTVEFDITNGEYGYVVGNPMLVSNTVIALGNVTVNTAINNTHGYFEAFETVYQPMGSIVYINGTGIFQPNTMIFTYYSNNSLKGSGLILKSAVGNSTSGFLTVTVHSGNLSDNTIYSTGNTISANLAVAGGGYTDITASGIAISQSSTSNLHIINVTGSFQAGEEIYQSNTTTTTANGILISSLIALGNGVLSIQNDISNMIPNQMIFGRVSGAQANLVSIDMALGLISVNGIFSTDSRAGISNCFSGTTASVFSFSVGTGAGAAVGMTDTTETINVNVDFIFPQCSINLDSIYGFTGLPSANLTSNISASLSSNTLVIGRITGLTNIAIGNNYNVKPKARFMQPYVYPYLRKGYHMDTIIQSGSFQTGELVQQPATGARGFLRAISNNFLVFAVSRASLFSDFVATTNSTTILIGVSSGAVANVLYVQEETTPSPRVLDFAGEYIGFNSNVSTNTQIANGSATAIDVTVSGYGFQQGEVATFIASDGIRQGSAAVNLIKQGTGAGFYTQLGGRLSSEKKLFDGFYYQDFSYEVRSSITLNTYKDMLLNVLHVAGTVPFGALYKRRIANAAVAVSSSKIRQTFGAAGYSNVVGIGASTARSVGIILAGAALIGANAVMAPALVLPIGESDGTSNASANATAIFNSVGIAKGFASTTVANGTSTFAVTSASKGTAAGHSLNDVAPSATILPPPPGQYWVIADDFERSANQLFIKMTNPENAPVNPTNPFVEWVGSSNAILNAGAFEVANGTATLAAYTPGPIVRMGVCAVLGGATIFAGQGYNNVAANGVILVVGSTGATLLYRNGGANTTVDSISANLAADGSKWMFTAEWDNAGNYTIFAGGQWKQGHNSNLPVVAGNNFTILSNVGTRIAHVWATDSTSPELWPQTELSFDYSISNSAAWSKGAGWTVNTTSHALVHAPSGSSNSIITFANNEIQPWIGEPYNIEFTLAITPASGSVTVSIGEIAFNYTSNGTYDVFGRPANNTPFQIMASHGANCSITNLSIRKTYD